MNTWTWGALAALAIGLVVLVWMRQRRPVEAPRKPKPHQFESLDTVMAWEPHATRILSSHERQAYAVLVRALPECMVLAQVPLSRFLKVPTRYSYAEWLKRAGSLSADLVVCDRNSEVMAVVEVRSARESERARQRLERMERVLEAAKIRVLVWQEGELPSPAAVRQALLPDGEPEDTPSRHDAPMGGRQFGATGLSSMPVAEVDDTTPGDLHEPPPSTWFDDFEQQPTASSPQQRRP
ncbi:DUF2726 domain-containing protein [Ideonella sp. BN130291]|uniref:DUF2726 domain-containing protein n=1 Tax=Ideonella sp. BN130291 TaxID=3112940 RepID=UPI002E26F791|nr:DUF2726 domain-containing protein [Ideonella sp. BN130291]